MIEATTENIWYKKRKRRFISKRFFLLFIFIFIILSAIFYYRQLIAKQIINICKDYAYSYSTDSVNKAVLTSLSNKVKYDDLIKIEKNSSGDIVLMATDSYKVNVINREIADSAKIILEEKIKNGTPIPSLAFTGISFLAGYGQPVLLKTLSVSSVVCDFDSIFKSVGVNQTLHSIYIVVNSKVFIEMPFVSEEIDCKTSVLIGESVLVGKVPEVYLGGKLFS